MAKVDRFYIGQLNAAGMQTNLKPFAIPDDAFEQLDNAYIFRGRVRKRFGSQFMQGTTVPVSGYEQLQSRLRINLGTTNGGTGNFSGSTPQDSGSPIVAGAIGQMFSVGNQIFTVNALGTPAPLLTTGSATGTYNTTTGALVLTGAALNTVVYFYPALPVMGFANFPVDDAAINNELLFAFDTSFAYQYTSSGWNRLGSAFWNGTNADFFWSSKWRGSTSDVTYLYTSNYNDGGTLATSDVIKYWDGTSWNNFSPGFTSGTIANVIVTARIILPFKDRLILLNVVENTGGNNLVYTNRCRFSWNGDPTNAAAFYENVPGSGGYIDAPTKESIITAQFLRDRLIVYFESSTWELVYTGNQILPFIWQQINTELGAESTFSQVPFDKYVLGVGNVGIHSCNGTNVERIDDKIPDVVFQIHNANSGNVRVAGIRDYYVEMVYWSFPDSTRSSSFPYNNKVLTYNYKTGSWGFNDDSITTFGYYQISANEGETWGSNLLQWQQEVGTWADNPQTQPQFRLVVAGNQEGFTFIVNPDVTRNAPALQITNMSFDGSNIVTITCIDHNLEPGLNATGDYVIIESAQGITGVNNNIYAVNSVINANSFTIIEPSFAGTYEGGGTLARVSSLNIQTKQFNFYAEQGFNAAINKVDFLVDATDAGQVVVDYAVSSSSESQLFFASVNGSLLGNGVLDTSPYPTIPLEQTQSQLWHPIYPMSQGEYIQFKIYMDESQITDKNIAWADFQLHAFIVYAQPTSSRLQ